MTTNKMELFFTLENNTEKVIQFVFECCFLLYTFDEAQKCFSQNNTRVFAEYCNIVHKKF